jgi:hypothetical protein
MFGAISEPKFGEYPHSLQKKLKHSITVYKKLLHAILLNLELSCIPNVLGKATDTLH